MRPSPPFPKGEGMHFPSPFGRGVATGAPAEENRHMSQLQERITQFRKMANDDPDNELGHFRLGQLLMENLQFEEAVQSFQRTLELSPQFSKVYQLLGSCFIKLDRRAEAVAT